MKKGLLIMVLTTIVFASTGDNVQESVMMVMDWYNSLIDHKAQVREWGMYAKIYSR